MNRTTVVSTAVSAAALVGTGIVQLDPQVADQAEVVGTAGHVQLTLFSVSLLAIIPLVLALGRLVGDSRLAKGAPVAAVALAALAAVGTVSNVRGEDPSFFPMIAAPSNLLWLAGLVMLAVGLVRSGRFPVPVALLLPLTWMCTIPLAQMSAGFAGAVLWLAILAYVSAPTFRDEFVGVRQS